MFLVIYTKIKVLYAPAVLVSCLTHIIIAFNYICAPLPLNQKINL